MHCVGFEVLTAVVMNAAIFWDTSALYSICEPTFRWNVSPPCSLATRWFLAGLIVDPKVGGDTFPETLVHIRATMFLQYR
jgi:hypothetical protein